MSISARGQCRVLGGDIMVRVCCFCDMVHDEAMGRWQEGRKFVPTAGGRGEAAILSYTCCRECFEADPRASVFRARRSQSSGSLDSTAARPSRLRWSGAAA
jgi:hypothetical protein